MVGPLHQKKLAAIFVLKGFFRVRHKNDVVYSVTFFSCCVYMATIIAVHFPAHTDCVKPKYPEQNVTCLFINIIL